MANNITFFGAVTNHGKKPDRKHIEIPRGKNGIADLIPYGRCQVTLTMLGTLNPLTATPHRRMAM